MTNPYFIQTIDKSKSGSLFNETAKGNILHIGYCGYLGEGNWIAVICMHKSKCFFEPSALVVKLLVRDAGIRQGQIITGCRKIVQN